MQRYELDAWLGSDHGLNEEQLTELLAHADEIEQQYPDADDQVERDTALTVAYQLMTESAPDVVAEYGKRRADARTEEAAATAGLRSAALLAVADGKLSEAQFARVAGVDRMTVRKWLGKR